DVQVNLDWWPFVNEARALCSQASSPQASPGCRGGDGGRCSNVRRPARGQQRSPSPACWGGRGGGPQQCQDQWRKMSDSSTSAVARAGLIALAVAMGIGRFAFTPVLPMMQVDRGMSVAAGAWLASANYLGYLVG